MEEIYSTYPLPGGTVPADPRQLPHPSFQAPHLSIHRRPMTDPQDSDSESAAIAADRASHPHCSYSSMTSSQSRYVNGQHDLTTLKRVLRNCRGHRPVEIWSDKKESSSAAGEPQDSGAPPRPFFPLGEGLKSFGIDEKELEILFCANA